MANDEYLWQDVFVHRWTGTPSPSKKGCWKRSNQEAFDEDWKKLYHERKQLFDCYRPNGINAIVNFLTAEECTEWKQTNSVGNIVVYARRKDGYLAFKTVVDRCDIPFEHLTELLLDPEKRMQWDKNVKLSTVLKVVDRTMDIVYTCYAGIDFCCLRHVAIHTPQQLLVASDSIHENPSVFIAPQPLPSDQVSRVYLRGTGFSARRLNPTESSFINIIQIKQEYWMDGHTVRATCQQRIKLAQSLLQFHKASVPAGVKK